MRLDESETGHQQRVAQERVQVAQVGHPAMSEIDVGLQRDAGRRGRVVHQVGVGGLLAADDHRGHSAGHDGVDAVLPRPVTAQDSHDGDVGSGEKVPELAVDEPCRIGPPVARTAGAGGDQIRVRGREKQNGRGRRVGGGHGHPPFVPHGPARAGGPAPVGQRRGFQRPYQVCR